MRNEGGIIKKEKEIPKNGRYKKRLRKIEKAENTME
jgi:hypothetical protein